MGEETEGDDEQADPREKRPSEKRIDLAFRAWLEALATDPEAATAAAMAYESLSDSGRDAWLDAIAVEAPTLAAPPLALYAPLLGVEGDVARRARIEEALAEAPLAPALARPTRALHGVDASGTSVAAIVIPLYLDFVELLLCRYDPDSGVESARRGPLLRAEDVWTGADAVRQIDGTPVTEQPLPLVIDGLAHALVADRRRGRPPPEPLRTYDFLFEIDVPEPLSRSSYP